MRRLAPATVKAVFLAAIVFFVARYLPLKMADIGVFLAHADVRFYGSLLLFALFLLLQAGIWVLIVNAAAEAGAGAGGGRRGERRRLPLRTGLRVFIDSQFAKYIPGGFWNYAGRLVLASREGMPMEAQLASIVYENVLLVTAALAYAYMLFVTLGAVPVATIPAVLAAAAFAYAFYPRVSVGARGFMVRASRWRPLRRLSAKLAKPAGGAAEGTAAGAAGGSAGGSVGGPAVQSAGLPGAGAVLPRRRFFGYLACFLGSHFIMGIAFWTLVDSFGRGRVGLLYAAGTFAASWLLGLLSPLPGGLGVREGFLVYFLSMKLGTDAALQISVIARLWNLMAEVLVWLAVHAANSLPRRVKEDDS